jgi:hypothetical protein
MDELILGLLLLLGLKSSRSGGRTTPTGPVSPTGPGGEEPGAPGGGGTTPGAPGGRIFGSGQTPDGWDPAGNLLYIAPDCDLVLEGERFEPRSAGAFNITAIEEATLVDTLAIPGNSVYGYIDWLMANSPATSTEAIALQIMREANALCADLPEASWPPALAQWFASFVDRIRPWVEEPTIPFGE